MSRATTKPLPALTRQLSVSADTVVAGQPIPKAKRLTIFSPAEWAEFTEEWAHCQKSVYRDVELHDGPGDMGRDVIAWCVEPADAWDNYQCKHYDHPLQPGNVWTELGKLVYYTFIGAYSYPRRYRFVAPRGAGMALSNLFRKPADLKAGLIKAWHQQCRTKITTTRTVELDAKLSAHLDTLDFSIFDAVPPLTMIEDHEKSPYHVARFGGGLPPRQKLIPPPPEPTSEEATYVAKLFAAYSEHLGQPVTTAAELSVVEPTVAAHFGRSREEFYSAESLRAFSRDRMPPGEFERVQDEVRAGIMDQVDENHPNGYVRV